MTATEAPAFVTASPTSFARRWAPSLPSSRTATDELAPGPATERPIALACSSLFAIARWKTLQPRVASDRSEADGVITATPAASRSGMAATEATDPRPTTPTMDGSSAIRWATTGVGSVLESESNAW